MMRLAQVDGPTPQANPTSNPQIYSSDQNCFGGGSQVRFVFSQEISSSFRASLKQGFDLTLSDVGEQFVNALMFPFKALLTAPTIAGMKNTLNTRAGSIEILENEHKDDKKIHFDLCLFWFGWI